MSNKINKKLWTSIIIFALLILVVLVMFLNKNKNGERNFKNEIINVETEAVDKIEYIKDGNDIILYKDGDAWKVSKNDTIYTADMKIVNSIFAQLSNVKPMRIAAVSKEQWGKFDFTPEKQIDVKYYSGKKEVANFSIGKFEYVEIPAQQQGGQGRGSMTTYLKENDGDENVYVINGFLKTLFPEDFNQLRNKALCTINKANISEISATASDPTNSFMLTQDYEEHWQYNGIATDSTKTSNYLSRYSNLVASKFYNAALPENIEPEVITIKGNNFSPVKISIYKHPIIPEDYIIVSSANPEGIFLDNQGNIRKRLFANITEFIKAE
ncbi:MAG: DUF4340 domain-containing protein [Bacteroidales bacterium]|jgi:hypothetical protein|nr:DUF4340 domain-containing protein [Bacteroidales bacterium]MDD2204453.1 DUF4340 domain-containing protein [Bacteroidales bacterium]MDD3151958.1 DUF4340 domain-containing protein [Bacteroidales bacterium]MDD3913961.1 DUF4340 domain-containing protein [Bacteroidales bacterium]MDD4633753.1 DUF4340 domain-containing protein [Bacteroidales bacterium]